MTAATESDSDVECRDCNESLEDGAVFCVYGDWDREQQGFERGDHSYHICRDCWHKQYDAKKATTYQTTDADELWAILSASEGKLVADLSGFFIPGPCYVRVVDDELHGATVNLVPSPEHEEYDFVNEADIVDVDYEFLDETLGYNDTDRDVEKPIWLVSVDQTPFADLWSVPQISYDR